MVTSVGGEGSGSIEEVHLEYQQQEQHHQQSEGKSDSTDDKRSLSPDNGASATQSNPSAYGSKKRKSLLQMARNQSRRASVPNFLKPDPALATFGGKVRAFIAQEANFYRIHVTVFTLTPLIFAGIMYASNTTHVAFIDCLFVCVTCMTVTGLTTINVSILTSWQQAIMYFLMTIGNISAVSVTMVLIRRHFFRSKFNDVIKRSSKARKRMKDVEEAHQKEKKREFIKLQRMIGLKRERKERKAGREGDLDDTTPSDGTPRSSMSSDEMARVEKLAKKRQQQRKKQQGPLRADMIRRIDEPAVLVNQAGMPSRAVRENSVTEDGPATGGILSEQDSNLDKGSLNNNTTDIRFALPEQDPSSIRREWNGTARTTPQLDEEPAYDPLRLQAFPSRRPSTSQEKELGRLALSADEPMRTRFEGGLVSRDRSGSDPPARRGGRHVRSGSEGEAMRIGASLRPAVDMFPRTQTIEFSEPFREREKRASERVGKTSGYAANSATQDGLKHRSTGTEFDRTPTIATMRSSYSRRPTGTGIQLNRTPTTSKERGFGGFPTPFEIAGHLFQKVAPKFQEQLTRTMTMPRSATLASVHSGTADGFSRSAPYLTFDATVTGNSRFTELTEAQRDELGGVEYRAIDLLAKILPAYWIFCNFFCITLVAPWLASKSAVQVHQVIAAQGATGPNTTWMWFFQVISAYSNTGLSLIDTSMIDLPTQYFMLIPMAFLILAGNTAFPIFLRLFIWLISIAAPKNGRMYETLRFLLDHPRRCFVYLFPSSQTWFLVAVLMILNSTDWIAFQVLDIGNSTIDSWSVGQRTFDGLFQSIAVRAAGFQIISLLSLAPAVQFLYIIMMYISAYPVAMSVRNTNVYEERSLGVFNEEPGNAPEPETGGAKVWGTYLAAHARRQLAFDIWWLGFALWLICIIEKHNIQDPSSDGWFTVFSCLFELTSAYGTVGLSTGTPYDDFSLSGRFSTLGKLVVIVVMLRGRHRGLPVAIDRAVLLPGELELEDEANEAYTVDEDGFVRSRSFAPSATNATVFPRTPTGISVPGTPRPSRYVREPSPHSQAIDGGGGGGNDDEEYEEEDEYEEEGKNHEMSAGGDRRKSSNGSEEATLGFPHFAHLAAIREATPSPSRTPTTTMGRMTSSPDKQEKKEYLESSGPSDTSSTSSDAKGKGRAHGQTTTIPQLLGGTNIEELPSNVVESNMAEESRLDQLDDEYRERYGSISKVNQSSS